MASKETDRRDFLKGAALFSLGQGCFLGRNSYDLKADAISMLTGGAVGGGIAAWFQIRESPEKKITRRELFSVIRNALGGAATGLAVGESFNWWERRKEVEEFLSGLPFPPEKNKKIAELSLSELATLINRLEGKIPSPGEADILLTATAYQAAQLLGESPKKAKEYAKGMFKILNEEEFRAICQPDTDKETDAFTACSPTFFGGEILTCLNFSEEEWKQLSASKMPIRSWVGRIDHEVAHMNVHRFEVFPRLCSRPEEDYGIVGRFKVFSRRGFLRNLPPPKGESLTVEGRVEEEFFAEWASYRFLGELEKVGLEKKEVVPMGYPEFLQAIVNLEHPDSDWPKLWQGAMDFSRVAKLHWESDLWSFRRDLGKVYSSYIEPPLELEEGNLAALGKLVFEAFSKTDAERLKKFLQIKSEKDLVSL